MRKLNLLCLAVVLLAIFVSADYSTDTDSEVDEEINALQQLGELEKRGEKDQVDDSDEDPCDGLEGQEEIKCFSSLVDDEKGEYENNNLGRNMEAKGWFRRRRRSWRGRRLLRTLGRAALSAWKYRHLIGKK